MRIILLDKIKSLGNIGDEVDVKAGYARNFLIPTAKALLATKENIDSFKATRAEFENNLAKKRLDAQYQISEIKKIEFITIQSKSGVSGKLFGSIGPREISNAVFSKSGIKISKYNIFLPNGKKIRALGEYDVVIKIDNRTSTMLNVRVVNIVQ